MGLLDVINVGQGDCMVLRPRHGCVHEQKDIFVDLGPGNVDVSKYIQHDKIAIFITHHHADHLDGIKYFINDFDKISEIILPFYQNEISLIAQAILKLKGFGTAKNCSYFKSLLQAVVNNQQFLFHIHRNKDPRLLFAYEGMRYCNHIEVLNPPIVPQCANGIRDISIQEIENTFHELFVSDFADDLTTYLDFTKKKYLYEDPISRNFLQIQSQSIDSEFIHEKTYVVLDFIVKNMQAMSAFNAKPTQTNIRKLYDNYVACTHDCCTVLKVDYNDATLLLTGDASKKVFNRLIKEKKHDLRAYYLKMPHHGSIGNISDKILEAIQPKVAIISHDNGLFGRATDPHPNQKVIDMLRENKIEILVTNDVIKHGDPVIKKSDNITDKNICILA